MRERERVRYGKFVQSRYSSLYRLAYLLTGNHHSAEDLVQTALTKVYLSWGRVRRAEDSDSYVRQMLANEAVSARRRRSAGETPSDSLDGFGDRGVQVGPEDGVVQSRMVWQALGKLTARQRAVVVLRYYEDLSEAQIGAVLNIAPGTVKGHARAALAALGADLPAERPVHRAGDGS